MPYMYIYLKKYKRKGGGGCYKISVIEWYSKNPYHDLIYIGLHRKYTVLMRELYFKPLQTKMVTYDLVLGNMHCRCSEKIVRFLDFEFITEHV